MHAFKATEVSSAVHGSSLQSTIPTGVHGKEEEEEEEEEEDGAAAATTLTNCVSSFDDCRDGFLRRRKSVVNAENFALPKRSRRITGMLVVIVSAL